MTTLWESFEGRRIVTATSAEVIYFIGDAADENDVEAKIAASVPSTYGSLILENTEIAERLADDTWKVIARYKRPDIQGYTHKGNPDKTYAFDTGSETVHITQSRATIARHGVRASALQQGAINCDGQTVRGLDVPMPAPTFSETHWWSDAEMTSAYKRLLAKAAYRVNGATWRDYSKGEVLFVGASGSRRGDDWDDPWEVTYKFAVRENESGLAVGSITGIDKEGWQYMWVQYGPSEDPAVFRGVQIPVAVYIEKIFNYYDFSNLGIDA